MGLFLILLDTKPVKLSHTDSGNEHDFVSNRLVSRWMKPFAHTIVLITTVRDEGHGC